MPRQSRIDPKEIYHIYRRNDSSYTQWELTLASVSRTFAESMYEVMTQQLQVGAICLVRQMGESQELLAALRLSPQFREVNEGRHALDAAPQLIELASHDSTKMC